MSLVWFFSGAAFADKIGGPEKLWRPISPPARAIYPEQEPNDSCPGQLISGGDTVSPASYDPSSDDDWYQFFAVADVQVTIATGTYDGSDVDTYLELYDSDCVTLLAYNDDGGPGLFSFLSNFQVPHTGYYNIKSFSYGHHYTGFYELYLYGAPPPIPDPNDVCTTGYVISRCGTGTVSGDMSPDHDDYDPGADGCANGYPEAGIDVTYQMDLEQGDWVDLTYNTPNHDAAIYIITDCENPAGSCVVGADAGYDTETINWIAPAAGTYYVILDHYGTGQGAGPWTLEYDMLNCPPPGAGACCYENNSCHVLWQEECEASGGIFHPEWENCDVADCGVTDPPRACCVDGDCYFVPFDICVIEMGGQWMGDPSCEGVECPPVAAISVTWGKIKASYRGATE
ncbi:MAG: PPC domain-containing protein [Candidatus Eisenbacteria bacterium]